MKLINHPIVSKVLIIIALAWFTFLFAIVGWSIATLFLSIFS